MLGVARAAPIARSTCAGVTDSPAASATMQPFCAPPLRSSRVSLRVSMPAMPTVFSRRRYSPSDAPLRKFDSRAGTSLTTSPAAKTRADSTSSLLVP